MNMATNEEIRKSLKGVQDNTNRQYKEINKTAQDLKSEIESINKTQTYGILGMKNLETQRRAEANFINIMQEMEKESQTFKIK